MIRSLHISKPTNTNPHIDYYLADFVDDVYLNHLSDRALQQFNSREGVSVVVDDAAVVSLLLSKAGFLVRDLGKVSV